MSIPRLCAVLAVALSVPVVGTGAERLNDQQVKKLIEDIDTGYDVWKKDLEKQNLDDAVITSAERTIKVKTFLKDFERAIDTVESRFKPEFAATPEVLALLRMGSDVEKRQQREGESSAWSQLSAKLATLARAYGVNWPIESMDVRTGRLNDGELAAKVELMEKSGKQLRSESETAAKANKAIDKASRESLKAQVQRLESMSKDVRSRIQDDRPAAVEVDQLLAQTTKVKQSLTALSLFSAGGAWRGIETGTDALARAYHAPKP